MTKRNDSAIIIEFEVARFASLLLDNFILFEDFIKTIKYVLVLSLT